MNAKTSTPITSCQICGYKSMKSMIFVGFIPPVNTMPLIDSTPVEQLAYPLELLRCPECSLVQIGLEVDQNVLFPPEYPYLSGTTKILRENFADLYRECHSFFDLKASDLVVDIGSNDGTLLSNFKDGGHKVLGIEPSQAGEVAKSKGINTRISFFNEKTAAQVKSEMGTAKIITAANVFAHIGDVHSVVDGITHLLDQNGVFVSESHYLLDLVNTLQYDTIYHEHLRYYSLGSLSHLLNSHGLEVFRVKKIPSHGGSIRVYSARKGRQKIHESVHERLEDEKRAGLMDGSGMKTFGDRVVESKVEFYALLSQIRKRGQRIFGIGAPSRASTLINYIGINDGMVEAVMEVKGSHKIGKYIPGTRIPVLEESLLIKEQPDYALFLSWHIADELAVNLRKKGFKGKFITPLPVPRVFE